MIVHAKGALTADGSFYSSRVKILPSCTHAELRSLTQILDASELQFIVSANPARTIRGTKRRRAKAETVKLGGIGRGYLWMMIAAQDGCRHLRAGPQC